ncbi:ATPase [Litorisediminicola beolgyonensis]|uniref:ATPase n=1 Tax=Litorisediminicola beolgyonensis TaxID=1173614 RepID=A0ABW3ZE13_9RHOB
MFKLSSTKRKTPEAAETAPAAEPTPDVAVPESAPTPTPSAPLAAAEPTPVDPADERVVTTGQFPYFKPPRTIEETGLSESFLIGLTAKVLYDGGTMTPADIGEVTKLPKIVCRSLIKEMTHLQYVEALGLETQDIKSDIRYQLTDAGRKAALEALQASSYIGPAPVSLFEFEAQIGRQSITHEQLQHHELEKAFSHLVIADGMIEQLGPAANSGRSMLFYGEPGNGKTSLAEAIGMAFKDTIYFPHAILVGSQIIRFYDDTLHVEGEMPEDPIDQRWVPCKRPVVIAGGELTLAMLDLMFEPGSRFYEAPMHLKALGGVFVLDDFGRQTAAPQAFLNRWIVPLEKGFDILSLHTGKKFTVPFDQLVVFSSNMMPEELGDGAALRRIYFKIFVPSPTKEDYLEIFRDAAASYELEWKEDIVSKFYDDKYVAQGLVTSGAHPGFLIRHILAAARYLDRKAELSRELLDLAWRNVAAAKKSHTHAPT